MEYADRWQLNQSRTMRHFKSMLSDWKEEKDQKRKDDLARTIRDFAKLSLEEWKASNISEKKQERFETRKERRTRR
jgi:hypothetical protein